ncbi:MAG: polyhydroxyalkanoate depolymerase [Pseudomonadota bacterium]
MLYSLYEVGHAMMTPLRAAIGLGARVSKSAMNPWAQTLVGRQASAALDVFEATTRRYGKPEWGTMTTKVNGQDVAVRPTPVLERPFGTLLRFERDPEDMAAARGDANWADPRVLIVAPMSGHYATLLRGTVEAMLPEHDVYITDWTDARMVSISDGRFDLNDFIDYLIEFFDEMGPKAHGVAVCQPGPGLLSAIAVMSEDGHHALPSTMTVMGSPIDARCSPTVANQLAMERSTDWFEGNMIYTVPWPYPGVLRRVYPGFVQLYSFMSMNSDRHLNAHYDFFTHLVEGDGDSVQKHRKFYDEYLSVMDITEEFYMQTIIDVFQEFKLAKGLLEHRGRRVDLRAIDNVSLLTVEGENDDISGIGQTQAAHDLCVNIPKDRKFDYVQAGVGHYGVFNGSRWRTEIQPRVRDLIRSNFNMEEERDIRRSADIRRRKDALSLRVAAE